MFRPLLVSIVRNHRAGHELAIRSRNVTVKARAQPVARSKNPVRPAVSGDAELPALPVTGRREFLGRQILGQIRRLVERADLDPARA